MRYSPAKHVKENGGHSVKATCFPTEATLANSWDPALAASVGCAIGAFNGLLIVKLKMNAFIVTLASYIWVRGVVLASASDTAATDTAEAAGATDSAEAVLTATALTESEATFADLMQGMRQQSSSMSSQSVQVARHIQAQAELITQTLQGQSTTEPVPA